MRRNLLVVALAATLLCGCSSSSDPEPTAGAAPPPSSTTTATTAPTITTEPTPSGPTTRPRGWMIVPVLAGLHLSEVRPKLRLHGLRLGSIASASSPCLPAGQVLRQRPRPERHRDRGTLVDIVVNRPVGECDRSRTPPPANARWRQVGSLFLDFATGRKPYPPSDTPVGLLLGSRRVATLDTSQVGHRPAWRICPSSGSYAAATCPFSAIDVLRDFDGPIAITSQRPQHPCAARADTPYDGHWITLTPAEPQSCVTWFAVVLGINDVGQVTDVDLVLAEP
jgi:hypothetical protein